jgi:hypothetical protein
LLLLSPQKTDTFHSSQAVLEVSAQNCGGGGMFLRLVSFGSNPVRISFLVVASLPLVPKASFPDDDTTKVGKVIHPFFQKISGDTGHVIHQRSGSLLAPGTRVRVTAPAPEQRSGKIWESEDTVTFISRENRSSQTFTRPGRAVTGTLVAATTDNIVLELSKKGQNISIPRGAIVKLEVSEAPSRRKRGAILGAFVGVGVAFAWAAILESGDDDGGYFSPSFDLPVYFAGASLLLAPAGAAVGAIVAPGERWRSVTTDTVSLPRAPVPRVCLTFAIRF